MEEEEQSLNGNDNDNNGNANNEEEGIHTQQRETVEKDQPVILTKDNVIPNGDHQHGDTGNLNSINVKVNFDEDILKEIDERFLDTGNKANS